MIINKMISKDYETVSKYMKDIAVANNPKQYGELLVAKRKNNKKRGKK